MNILKDYFHFNASQRKGIVFLLFIIIVLVVYNIIAYKFVPESKYDYSDLKEIKLKEEKDTSAYKNDPKKEYKNYPQKNYPKKGSVNHSKKEVKLYPFNPNTASKQDWQNFGLSDKQSISVLNYLKNGSIKSKEDLKKIYVISDDLYFTLEPYIVLNVVEEIESDKEVQEVEKKIFVKKKLELNKANPEELKMLWGIGPVLSKRIVKYRNSLGGFLNVNQLKEVYGIKDSVFIMNDLSIESVEVQKIKLNTVTAKELIKHPYITSWDIVNDIINTRDRYGGYKDISNIKKLEKVSNELYTKLEPYLSL